MRLDMLFALRGDIQKHLAAFAKPHKDEEIDEAWDIGDVSMYDQQLVPKNMENRQLITLRMRRERANNLIVVNNNKERINLDPGSRVRRRSGHPGRPKSMGQKRESEGKRRERTGSFRMASQGNISLYLVRHGKMATEQVATQVRKVGHIRLPLPSRRTVGRAPGGKVQPAHRGKKPSREKRTTGMEVSTRPEQDRKERKRANRARKTTRRGGKTGDFLLNHVATSYD